MLVCIDDIKPADYNPRRIDDAALAGLIESIRVFGMPQPLVVNKRTGTLVSGHQRLRAARQLGWTDVPVEYVDLDEAQERALNITLNNKHIAGDYTADVIDILAKFDADFLHDLRLDLISVPVVEFTEPEPKPEPEEKKPELKTCPNCGVLLDG